uniref:Cytochrome P450 monooxygenase rdc4 n=1 Tax=Metacordyceps chlamydosporia TaxID=280754 RepID=RDC4_METCM|nr:RecName: Full=Cytochrome P450 monooxygenase rdc4; AltName: Full=Hypothemycin biosynthesis cluster protein rdc4 [Pochonia chlamydosporia]ACD39773.1 cytochrome P450 [Pochonia chlamydosporia]
MNVSPQLLGYVVYTAIYNVYFHPLANFPGPKYLAASRIPLAFKRLTGEEVAMTYKLHIKYGPYVRVSPDELSTISTAATKDVYGHNTRAGGVPKDFKAYYMKNQRKDGTEGLLTAGDEEHYRQRKVFAPAFSDRAIREQEPLLKKYTDLLVAKSYEKCQTAGKVDMVMFFNFATFDFIADCVFGDSLHHLESMEYHPFLANITATVRFSAMRRVLRSFPILQAIFEAFMPKSMIKKRLEHVKFCDERVMNRLANDNPSHPDFWTLVEHAEAKGNGLTKGEMRQNGFLLLTAATETTSSLMSAITYLLCKNPEKMKKLQAEVRGAFKSTDEMNTITLPKLQYLQMAIEEGLRVYPPVPGGLPRRVVQPGTTLDGSASNMHIQSVVFYSQYASYHSPSHFARPHEFIPERWSQNPPAEFANDRLEAVQAFSAGPRDCIGKNLAYHEARMLLAKFVFTYDIELCKESSDWIKQKVYIVGAKSPLWVKLVKHERAD